MACKDCSKSAPKRLPEKKPAPLAVPTGGTGLVEAVMRAEELLGGSASGLTNTEVVDALCLALTTCREEQSAMAKALDEKENELQDCRDELDDTYSGEDDSDGDEETLDSAEAVQTKSIPTKTLGQAIRESQLRQDSSVQQPQRRSEHSVGRVHPERVLRPNQHEPVLELGPRLRTGDAVVRPGNRPAELPLLREQLPSTTRKQQHSGSIFPGRGDHRQHVGGHLFSQRNQRPPQR